MFAKQGKVELAGSHVEGHGFAAYSMDCSQGQSGGPLQTLDGQLVGIHTGVEHIAANGNEEDFYCSSLLT